ncbi:MAG: FlgD immunoglobulin-like domain containing protein [bacterium]
MRGACVHLGLLLLLTTSPLARAADSWTGRAPTQTPVVEPTMPRVGANLSRRSLADLFRDRETGGGLRGAPNVELDGYNESVVAINPTNPSNVAYASLFELRTSTDGGVTFAPAVLAPLPETYFRAGDPGLAFDSSGRLFWIYFALPEAGVGIEALLVECDPATGAVIAGPHNFVADSGMANLRADKAWMAIDANVGSPFQDRIYIGWTDFTLWVGNHPRTLNYLTYSTDHGATWSPAEVIGGSTEVFRWPVHLAVATNGDLYYASHIQVDFLGAAGGVPDGTSGRINVRRSTDGGVTFPQGGNAFENGFADHTFNNQSASGNGAIPGAIFTLQGSVQPWVLPDPNDPAIVCVVAADDPDDDPNSGDAANVYLTRSTDFGVTWAPRVRVDSGPGTTFQVMPSAAIDPITGYIVVTWYDNRALVTNADGNYLLDTYAAVSVDGGLTFSADFRINDAPFDPDAGAPCYAGCAELFYRVWAVSSSDVHVITYTSDNGVDTIHHWDGSAWTAYQPAFPSYVANVWASGPSDGWAIGSEGAIARWNGSTWTMVTSPVTTDLYGLHGRSATDVYAVGAGGVILHWDGFAWTQQTSGTTLSLSAVYCIPGGDVWTGGRDGVVFRSDGNGWIAEPTGTLNRFRGVWGSSNDDVWAVTNNGSIMHRDASGWTNLGEHGAPDHFAITGFGPNDVYVTGYGDIVHWDGNDFSRRRFSGASIFSVQGPSASNVYASGSSGQILHYDGTEWIQLANPGQSASFPTTRIGEYNGTAVHGVAAVTWTGNLDWPDGFVTQQSIFTSFSPDDVSDTPILQTGTAVAILEPGTPNPFRWVTNIAYSIPAAQSVRVTMHDVAGRRLAVLDQGARTAGRHFLTWDGRDEHGAAVGSGVYFARLEARGEVLTTKVVLAR